MTHPQRFVSGSVHASRRPAGRTAVRALGRREHEQVMMRLLLGVVLIAGIVLLTGPKLMAQASGTDDL